MDRQKTDANHTISLVKYGRLKTIISNNRPTTVIICVAGYRTRQAYLQVSRALIL